MSRFFHCTPIRLGRHTFSKFEDAVKDYHQYDVGTKNAIMEVFSSVVSIICHTGDKVLFIGSGTITECDEQHDSFFVTILTSAHFLQVPDGAASLPSNLNIDVYLCNGKLYEGQVSAYDLHYNVATIKIESSTPQSTATVCDIDESIAIDSKNPVLVPHHGTKPSSSRFNLCPGELVIALGRNCYSPNGIMASPGVFSAGGCDCSDDHFCRELFCTTCVVTKIAVGGPLVNRYGEVIGVNFFHYPYNTFLPMNTVSKCLKELKKNGKVPRPWLGVFVSSLYTAGLDKLDKLYHKFPHVVKGVIVEQVIENRTINPRMERTKTKHYRTFWSARNWLKAMITHKKIRKNERSKSLMTRMERTKPSTRRVQAEQKSPAGLCVGDVIIKCGETQVGSRLEFVDALWDKEGKPVEVIVIRPGIGQLLLTVSVGTCPELNKWHTLNNGFLDFSEKRLANERKVAIMDKME